MAKYNTIDSSIKDRLAPSQLIKLASSLGVSLTPTLITKIRNRGGYLVGDDKSFSFSRLLVWLIKFDIDTAPKKSRYEIVKARAAETQRITSMIGREIGPLPDVVNPERRESCEGSFKRFCEVYMGRTFTLPWSKDHDIVIKRIETTVLVGGQFAIAMPRGDGKTSLCEAACIFSLFYGHRQFVALIGASEAHATELLASIKTEMEINDLLLEDFPEVCYPIRKLDGISHRASGQILNGRHTTITWTDKGLVLPTIAGSKSSGSVVKVGGITGRIRGMKHKTADGDSIRPDLVIVDDPQTDESAYSMAQCAARDRVLNGSILGLVGPTRKMACVMPCTVIAPGDLADSVLDPIKNPDWNGIRTKMVYEFPTNNVLWEQYAELRANSLREYNDIRRATEFYLVNRAAMDEGSVVAWAERYDPDEISALQHAMNLKLKNEISFFSERQNEPLPILGVEAVEILTADGIMDKINNFDRMEIPAQANHLTMFIDVQEKLLYWVIMAFEENFTCHVVDYGTFPQQTKHYFSMRDVQYTLRTIQPGTGMEGAIYAGLDSLVNEKMTKEYVRDDGVVMHLKLCLIDASWGQTTNLIYNFCRRSRFAANIMPSHGRYYGASSRPLSEYQRKRGDRVGDNWKIPSLLGSRSTAPSRTIRHVVYDTNYWKSFIFMRLAVKQGDTGCMSLFGNRRDLHRMYAGHLKAEYCVKTEAGGRVVYEWKSYPTREDNHLFDCTVGCCVAASIEGIALRDKVTGGAVRSTPALRFSEIQRRKREQRNQNMMRIVI